MGPPSYMRSVVDRNVVMRRMTVNKLTRFTKQRGNRKSQQLLVYTLSPVKEKTCESKFDIK
jgi:hypothetical protein